MTKTQSTHSFESHSVESRSVGGEKPKPIDEDAKRAQTRLAESPYFILRNVQCRARNGAVILQGQVDSFYHKQLAQETVKKTIGERRIVNQIEVESGAS